MNGIAGSWWEWIVSPHEAAFSRVFDGMIKSRKALREAFSDLLTAKEALATFHVKFTALPATTVRSEFRREYQDMKSELDADERRLRRLSSDLETLQRAANEAHQGKVPWEKVADEVAMRGITLHEITEADIEAAGRGQLAGLGGWVVSLLVFVWALRAIQTIGRYAKETFIGRAQMAANAEARANIAIAEDAAAKGVVPIYPGQVPGALRAIAAPAGLSLATLGLIAAGGWFLLKPKRAARRTNAAPR